MNRNDKNKKFTPLNINNVFKGKAADVPNKTSGYRVPGMQNIGKVSSMRRVPPPKWTPSIKAETGASENKQIINQALSGWVNPTSQDVNDPNVLSGQLSLNKDKNQWSAKASSNKPFFLMGQEFPSLPSDVGQDVNIDFNKDNNKLKETDSVKSKLEGLRNRDDSISASTLNRIDALSISKCAKGDIAATGWAAEDEEPNFDEKIVFSDEESLNEIQNWHSDAEEVVAKADINTIRKSQPDSNEQKGHQMQQSQYSMGETWYEHSQRTTPPQSSHYPQFQQFQMQMSIPVNHQFIPQNTPQFSHPNVLSRSSTSSTVSAVTNPINEDQVAFLNSVAEQRNARNMEYVIAIERARQKKMGASGVGGVGMISRGYGAFNEDVPQSDQQLMCRSRHTSMTSDTTNDCCTSTSLPMMVEMGPPGGPPMIHSGLLHHNQQQQRPTHISSMSMSSPSTLIRFAQTPSLPPTLPSSSMSHPQFVMPIQAVSLEQITDPKLMEKWLEFLKQQHHQQQLVTNSSEINYDLQQTVCGRPDQETTTLNRSMNDSQVSRQVLVSRTGDDGGGGHGSYESEKPIITQSPMDRNVQLSGLLLDKDRDNVSTTTTSAERKMTVVTDTTQKDNVHKTKSLYSTDDERYRDDNSKRYNRNNKFDPVKEYRSNKHNSKTEYSGGVSQEYSEQYRGGDDDLAYEDYHVFQQHHPAERHSRDYKSSQDFRKNYSYQYYEEPYTREPNEYGYKSSSLKYKPTKSKEYNKSSAVQVDNTQSERGHVSTTKKPPIDNQEYSHSDRDNFEVLDKKSGKEVRRNMKTDSGSYSNKRYDSRPYKERPPESSIQEFSMGFAVNPKDSRRNNYYPSPYNRRYFNSDYQYYGNYQSANNGSNYQQYNTDYDESYYQTDQYSYHQYKQDMSYPSSSSKSYKKSTKAGTTATTEQWRQTRSDKVKHDPGPTKANGRSNRGKNDKRQSSTSKDFLNENDQEEWATASEGGSERSNSAAREGFKSTITRHHSGPTEQQSNNEDSNKKGSSNTNQRSNDTKFGSSTSCNGSWPSYPDEDGSDGASGSAGGARSTNARINSSLNKSTESTETRNTDNKSSTNDSASKDGSNNNNSHKESSKPTERMNRTYSDYMDTNRMYSVINVDKLPEVTEDEELLYENVEQFQEVLSKATKKNRKLEEQKRLKKEMEQKKLESLRLNNRNNNKNIAKPMNRKEVYSQKIEKSETYVNRKIENKPLTISREKDSLISNNNFKTFDCNKVSMQIGSWDNSLADDINTDKKVPPKPIGTPASTSSWNAKVKSIPKCNPTTVASTATLHGTTESGKDNSKVQIDAKNVQATKNIYLSTTEDGDVNFNSTIAYSYKNPMFDRTNEDKTMKEKLEPKSSDTTLSGPITFEYDGNKNNCESNQIINPLFSEHSSQKNDQQSLNDKINLVKTIWDNQPTSVTTSSSEVNRTIIANVSDDLDCHTTTANQDTMVSRNVVDSTPTLSITNVCKVKPQLQRDFVKKEPIEQLLSSSAFAIRNSSATFLAQPNQANFIPYSHPFPSELISDHLHASDAFASLFPHNQPSMHINYNLANPHHLLDSSLLRQNAQDHILTNKMNFISQQSFYPQAAVTPKLFSNAGQMPINMDINSSHGALPLQQLLLTRQNSLTSMMQPFIQSSQQHGQTPLFPATPIIGPSNFTNPFSQGHLPAHYSPGNFPSLHQNQQFQQSHQMLLNHQQQQQQQQHHHHHQQQQMLQNQISHDRIINSGLPDFNGQPKHLNPNNIMHGMNGSAIMLPHNLNILMKPHLFATSSQYTNLQAPIQSNYPNIRNTYDNHSNIKLSTELDIYKSVDNNMIDRNTYCIDNYTGLPKQREDFYVDQNEFENCDINNDNWINNLRQNSANNFVQTLDFHSQRSPIQFPVLDPNISYNDAQYRFSLNNVRDNYQSLSTNTHCTSNYVTNHRNKPQFQQDQTAVTVKPTCRGFDNGSNFVNNDHNAFSNKNELNDNQKISQQTSCDTTVTSEPNDTFGKKEIINSEKSFAGKKKNCKQRSSFSDNFDDKNQSWPVIDDENEDSGKLKYNAPVVDQQSVTIEGGHSPSKQQYSGGGTRTVNVFDNNNQCQYGYDETQLSSQTAESLGNFDSMQLKKMIMKLRNGPVMTFADFDRFEGGGSGAGGSTACHDVTVRKTAVVPRLVMPLQAATRTKLMHKSYNSANNGGGGGTHQGSEVHGTEFVGMGFYSRNRALTPPPLLSSATHITHNTQSRNYKTKSSRYNNSNNNSYRSSNHNGKSDYITPSIATTMCANVSGAFTECSSLSAVVHEDVSGAIASDGTAVIAADSGEEYVCVTGMSHCCPVTTDQQQSRQCHPRDQQQSPVITATPLRCDNNSDHDLMVADNSNVVIIDSAVL